MSFTKFSFQRKFLVFAIVFTFILQPIIPQEIKQQQLPLPVINAFNKKYIKCSDVEWAKKGNYFKASFSFEGIYYFAYYTTSGKWAWSEYSIEESELPVIVKNSLQKSQFKDWQIGNVNVILTRNKGKQYQAFIYDQDWNELELFFDSKGNLVIKN
jgi:hypothetical protein